jgi:hypothetical protein
VGSILGVGSIDWVNFTGKQVLFVCQICTQILWNYVKFEAKNCHFSVVYSWCYIFMVVPTIKISLKVPKGTMAQNGQKA